MKKSYIATGTFVAALAIILGAYANHGLTRVAPYSIISSFKTGVTYQLYHAFALILLGMLADQLHTVWGRATYTFLIWGLILFSLDLYLINLCKVQEWYTILKFIDFFPPIGGISFIIGWLCFGIAVLCKNK